MSFAYIDSHVHFWDRANLPYPWLDEVPTIAGRHTPAELRAEAGTNFPEQIVFVECGAPWHDEVQWVEQLAATEPRIAAIVAKCAINQGPVSLAAFATLRQHPLVRGVRHLIQHEPDPDFAARPDFIAGARALGAAGLSFDLCCFHPQLPAVVRLVRACPETTFILDHFGKPGIRAGLLDPWRAHLRELADLPNVVCKLSGLVTEADHTGWQIADLRPYVDHALAVFGPRRLLFGGDWPVVKLASPHSRWLDTALTLLAPLSAEERDAVFRQNARRIYRLP